MVAKRKRPKRKKRVLTTFIVILLASAALLAYAFNNLNPILISMAEARARQLAVEATNLGLDEVMGEKYGYSDLVKVVTDEGGNVTMIQANTLLMNDLASQAALAVQRNLGQLTDQGIKLPLGSATGIGLFSGSGPDITVQVVPVGSVTTRFVTAFESAGINQTRHEIMLETTTLMRIVIPTGADSVSVSASIPVAESIIVGQVPGTFVNLPGQDDLLNMQP